MQLEYPHDHQLILGAKSPFVYCFVFFGLLFENLVVFFADVDSLFVAAYIESCGSGFFG